MLDINNLSVLITDDMDSMRRSIRGMLKVMKIGNKIEFAENGAKALKILNEKKLDLAIIDWNMPIMNGQKLLENIRNSEALRDMPVIMITAESERDIITDVAESDIDAFLLKPLTLQALEDKIRAVIHLTNNPSPCTQHLLTARKLEESGKIPAAIAETKQALKANSSSSKIIRKLGILYSKIDKPEISEKCFTKAAAINKNDTVTRSLLIDFYITKDNLKNAIKYYEEAVAISDRMTGKGLNIGKLLIAKGVIEQAVELLNNVIKMSPHKNKMREEVAEIYINNSLFQFGREMLEKISKDHPERHDISLKIGDLYKKDGDTGGALIYYVRADDAVSGNVEAKLLIAKIYLEKGKVFLADEYLNAVLKIDPNNEEALELRSMNI